MAKTGLLGVNQRWGDEKSLFEMINGRKGTFVFYW